MQGKTATLIGAAALAIAPAFTAPAAAQASPVPLAASYADLLEPVSNAVERLKLADAEADARPAQLIQAQYHHHHHHHQARRGRGWYLQHGYSWFGGRWVIRPVQHHHHHHHHHV